MKKENKKNNDNEEELIFETSENIEVYNSFDEIGLREDLIKGKINV